MLIHMPILQVAAIASVLHHLQATYVLPFPNPVLFLAMLASALAISFVYRLDPNLVFAVSHVPSVFPIIT